MNEEKQLVEKKQGISALNIMATRLGCDQDKLLNTLKNTVFKGASNEELLALTVVANTYGLNPLTKEIYAFPARGGGIVPVVSVDGWINLCNSHPQFDGVEFEFEHDKEGNPISCTSIFHRKDRKHATKTTEYFSECSRQTEPWKMKHRMLRHKALIQGARITFGFAGIYDEDEAERIAEQRIEVVTSHKRPTFQLVDTTQEIKPLPAGTIDELPESQEAEDARKQAEEKPKRGRKPKAEAQMPVEVAGTPPAVVIARDIPMDDKPSQPTGSVLDPTKSEDDFWGSDDIPTGNKPGVIHQETLSPQNRVKAFLLRDGYSEPEFFAALKSLHVKTLANTTQGLSDELAEKVIQDWEILKAQLEKGAK